MIVLSEKDLALIKAILKKHVSQYEVRVFGSRAGGAPKPFSDIDLVIMTAKPLPAEVMANLREDFSISNLPIKVDLLDWSDTSESFREIIQKNSEILFHPI